jgi:UDP-glucose 4-epimerase
MPHSNNPGKFLVTGSSGFIGSHVASQLTNGGVQYLDRISPVNGTPARTISADLADIERLRTLASSSPATRILHLAAEAEVLTPWADVGGVLRSNEIGTYNLLTAYQPRLIVFASTSAAYGNAEIHESVPALETARPLGLYGMSKSMGEILLRDWARDSGNSAVAFRLGNVIGPRCRGLIPYLVEHARKHPDGSKPARMRGFGKLVRDYVPVGFVISLFTVALSQSWELGSFSLFNAGTGRGTSNSEVAELTSRILRTFGLKLNVAWEDPVAPGEAERVILNMSSTSERFGIPPPSEDEVRQAIEESVRYQIEEGG